MSDDEQKKDETTEEPQAEETPAVEEAPAAEETPAEEAPAEEAPAAEAEEAPAEDGGDAPAAEEAPADGGEIVVSARRREESLVDVPISMSVVSGDTLLRIVAVLVAISPAGAALSLDAHRSFGSAWRFPARPVWALRLIQITTVEHGVLLSPLTVARSGPG